LKRFTARSKGSPTFPPFTQFCPYFQKTPLLEEYIHLLTIYPSYPLFLYLFLCIVSCGILLKSQQGIFRKRFLVLLRISINETSMLFTHPTLRDGPELAGPRPFSQKTCPDNMIAEREKNAFCLCGREEKGGPYSTGQGFLL
jgi:hypothetical protein